jgi:hypothetical protein
MKLSNQQKVINKWVRALRSGKYKQTESYLQNEKGFCCLGVLCELAVKKGVISPAKKTGDFYTYAKKADILPIKVRKWAGLKQNDGYFKGEDGPTTLTMLNDHQGKTFKEIADVIESKPQGLFKEE